MTIYNIVALRSSLVVYAMKKGLRRYYDIPWYVEVNQPMPIDGESDWRLL